MSDTLAQFRSKSAAMFKKAEDGLVGVAKEFEIVLAEKLIDATPGFGNQYPSDTRYIPTGRLRGGWFWSTDQIAVAARYEGGPYSDYGAETKAHIASQIRSADLQTLSYLQNDVAYGHVVHEGLGNHTIARPWVTMAGTLESQHEALAEARRRVK